MFCEKCGVKVQEGAVFCQGCGMKVGNGSVTTNIPKVVAQPPQPQSVNQIQQPVQQVAPQPIPQPVQQVAPQPIPRPVQQPMQQPQSFQQPMMQQPRPVQPQQAPMYTAPAQPMYQQPMVNRHDEPLSVGSYIGMFLIMCIPFVGFIMLIVWAVGSDVNKNKKNYAIASILIGIIGGFLAVIFSGVLVALFGTVLSQMQY